MQHQGLHMLPKSQLRAAWVEQAVTPAPGCPLTGFIARSGPSTDVRDDLFARLLLLDSGEARLALITVDMLGTDIPTATHLRQRLAGVLEADIDAIMLNATHTHAGPATIELMGIAPVDTDFLRHLEDALCDLARRAVGALAPVTLSHRRGQAPDAGIVRRWPGQAAAQHPLDATLDVVRVDRTDGSPMGALVTLPCHAVAAGPTRSISADFPGVMADALKAGLPGAVIAFAQGCCGDINPASGVGTPDSAGLTGRRLAKAVRALLDAPSAPISAGPLRAATLQVLLPYDEPPARAELLELDRKSRAAGADAADRAMGEFARRTLATLDAGTMPPGVEATVQVFTIGQAPCLRIVGLPGEPLSSLGRAVREASPDPTIVLGYTNGLMGYVADRRAYDDPGYEIDTSFRYYGHPARFVPEAGERLVEAAIQLTNDGIGTQRKP
jgi:neutral ceramidase